MSPAEYIELSQMMSDSTGTHAMNAVAILTSYLLAAYFVGAKLSRFQCVAISILYSMFLFFPGRSAATGIHRAYELIGEFRSEYPEIAQIYYPSALGPVALNSLGATIMLGWILSLVFMFDIRRRARQSAVAPSAGT